MRPIISSPPHTSSLRSLSLQRHTCLVGDNGEGEDSGSGAGKEGDGEVKGEGDEPGRIFLADWPAEGLDPGR
ncbi:hypothetical protein L6232_26825, partial [Shewanella sp. C31]|nr:hypothetical protein [Shewanella electrica]